jgi:hypothetical protein
MLLVETTRCRAYAACKPVGPHPGTSSDVPSGYRASGSAGKCCSHLLLSDMTASDIIEKAIVAFTDDRVDGSRGNANGGILFKHICHQRICYPPDAQGIGLQDGCLQLSEFGDLHQANCFAEAIERGRCRWNLSGKEIVPHVEG